MSTSGGSDPGGGVAEVVAARRTATCTIGAGAVVVTGHPATSRAVITVGMGVVHRHCCDLQLGGDRVGQLLCLAGGGLDDRGQCLGDTGADVAGGRARLCVVSGAGLGDLGDRVMGRGGAILCGPGGNGDEDSFEKVTAFPAPEQ